MNIFRKIEKLIIYITEHEFDHDGYNFIICILLRLGWLLIWYWTIKASITAGYIGGLGGVHL